MSSSAPSTSAVSNTPKTMRAVLWLKPGPPSLETLSYHPTYPLPAPKPGRILLRIHALGLNRSELFTRQGHSPSVPHGRILGIEAVGTILETYPPTPPGLCPGTIIATAMGGLGRSFDGSYASHTLIPASQAIPLNPPTLLAEIGGWPALAALPELLLTTWGSLVHTLALQKGESLLIRGGTTSIGLAAISMAKAVCGAGHIAATTRRASDEDIRARLIDLGVDEIIQESGSGEAGISGSGGARFDKVLELVGTNTLLDSLKCAKKPGGVVCMTGIVGGSWSFKEGGFTPMEAIPTGVRLTTFRSDDVGLGEVPFGELVGRIARGELKVGRAGRVFRLEEMVEAHELMESNQADGKVVVVVD